MFRAEAKGRPLTFATAGVRGGNEIFRDRQTGSLWQQSTAVAYAGPLKGTRLKLYPFLLTSWGAWRQLHPSTLVLKPLPGYAARLGMLNTFLRQGVLGTAGRAPAGAFGHDTRLRPRAAVVGLETGGAVKAYPIAALHRVRVVNDTVGSTPVLIVHQPASDTTTAFIAVAGGRRLRFRADDANADRISDLGTHSIWNAYGLCTAGPMKGTRLRRLMLEPEFWFAWSEFHPKTQVYSLQGAR